jgi:hypothetical protein
MPLPSVETSMNWSGDIVGRARVDVPDRSRTNMALEPHGLRLHDARPIAGELSLDRQGFILARHACGLEADSDLQAAGPAYLDSVAAHLKRMTGAARVLPQGKGLLMRRSERAGVTAAIGPSRWVHCDYTPAAARKWVGWIEAWQGLQLRQYPRFAIYQTWRCLTPPPCDNTLVLCDSSSFDWADAIPFDACLAKPYDEPGNQFESQFARYNPRQRWFYFSDLEPDELIVFQGFDSDPDRYAQPLHNSIDLPDAPPDAAPRVSVEARFFAFFD